MSINRILTLAVVIISINSSIKVQAGCLTINENIRLPKDSVVVENLLRSLNSFLYSIEENKDIENWVLFDEKSETQILIDEIQGFVRNDTIHYKSYLTNVELLNDKKAYLIQVAYISLIDSQPMLKAIFEFIAYQEGDKFLFFSPLSRNTKDWNTKTDGNTVFNYQNKDTENLINQYIKYISEYDKILNVTSSTDYYFCDDCESMAQILRMAGILYKLDYSGLSWNGISFMTKDKVILLQTQRQSRMLTPDPHYLFHFRADISTPEHKNYFMICAGANVYSGCWGMNWSEIKKMFKEKMTENQKQDWLQLYFEKYNFGESKSKYLFVTTFINGLLIEKVEREQGFDAVRELFASGDMYEDRKSFFRILEDITGINETNFNNKVGKIIKEALTKLVLP